MYRTAFASDWVSEDDDRLVSWRGGADPSFVPGDTARATIDVFARRGERWERTTSRHVQRHWPAATIRAAASAAGLRVLAAVGQHRGAVLDSRLDELVHTKAVFVACRDDRPSGEEASMAIAGP
jgi:hypothetical protein